MGTKTITITIDGDSQAGVGADSRSNVMTVLEECSFFVMVYSFELLLSLCSRTAMQHCNNSEFAEREIRTRSPPNKSYTTQVSRSGVSSLSLCWSCLSHGLPLVIFFLRVVDPLLEMLKLPVVVFEKLIAC